MKQRYAQYRTLARVAGVLVVMSAAGCSENEPNGEPRTNADGHGQTDHSLQSNPVPTGARQILKDRLVAFDRIQVDRGRSRLLIDFQAPSKDPQQLITRTALFDWESGQQIDVLDWSVPPIVEFAPDGRRFAIISNKSEFDDVPVASPTSLVLGEKTDRDRPRTVVGRMCDVRVCDLASGDVAWTTGVSQRPFHDARFVGDGTLVTVGGGEGSLEIKHWDASRGQLRQSAQAAIEYPDPKARLSHDATQVAVWVNGSAPVKIYDAKTGMEVHSLAAGIVFNVAYSPDGRLVATAGQSADDADVCIFDAATGERLRTISCVARELEFSPDGKLLWTTDGLKRKPPTNSGSSRGAMRLDDIEVPYGVRIWDTSTGKRHREIETGLYRDGAVAFLSDHQLMTAGSPTAVSRYEFPARIYVWNLSSPDSSSAERSAEK